MKKLFLLAAVVLLGLSQSGCWAWLSGSTNTRITKYPDGKIVEETFSDDAAYYDAAAKSKEYLAYAADCPTCSPTEKMLLVAIAALSDKGFVPRGMNGYELTAKLGSDMVAIAPWGAVGFVAYEGIKRSGTHINGDNATYAPFENHLTGSDGSNANIPYRYSSPDNITTEIFEPAVLGE